MSEVMEENAAPNNRGVKRKKKRSASQMMKKLVRRRNIGNELETETYEYMCRIMDEIRNDFAGISLEDKLTFIKVIHSNVIGQEVELAKNQLGALVLDSLMKFVDLEGIERLVTALTPSLRQLCSDRFASHVIERAIQVCAERGNRKLNDDKIKPDVPIEIKEDEIEKYNGIALKLSRYIINNYEEFVWEQYPCFVMRTVVECLGGLFERVGEEPGIKKTMTYGPRRVVSDEYNNLLTDVVNRFLNWPQFAEMGKDPIASYFLQVVILTLKDHDTKLSSALIKKIKNDCFTKSSEEDISNVFQTQIQQRLLEICLSSSTQKMYKKLYKRFFSGNLKKIMHAENANYTVQRLMDSCPTKEDFEPIFDEICECLPDALSRHYSGVFSSLANACLRLQAKQGPFVSAMSKVLGFDQAQDDQSEHFIPVVMRLVTLSEYEAAKRDGRDIAFTLHGSLVIQAILQFNKPIKAVHSLLSMKGDELVTLLGDPKGSRILDVFMDSKYVGEKSREKLEKRLKGHYCKLACGVHGSRCLDKIWEVSKSNQKNLIMEELAASVNQLSSTKSGSIISAKLNVRLFAQNKKAWSASTGKGQKAKELFADIIGTDEKHTS